MNQPAVIAAGLFVAAFIGLAWALAARHALRKQLDAVSADLEAERKRAAALGSDAARLTEVRERAEKAERTGVEQLNQRRDLDARVATLEAVAKGDRELRVKAEEQAAQARAELAQLAARVEELQRVNAALDAERGSLRQQDEHQRAELADNKSKLEMLNIKLVEQTMAATRAESERDAAVALQKDTAAFLDKARAELRASFTEAASKVFDEKAMALDRKIEASGEKSRVGLESTLKPFQESVNLFRERLETITTENTKGRAELVGKIDELKTLNQNMGAATDSLTRALKGNAKVRGDWGELVLETVLKASGLVEGSHYFRQVNVRDEDLDKRRAPDVVVHLPDGRKVVVDSKVNLVAWAEATNADDPQEVKDALLRHAQGLRAHVRDLSEKNYPALVGADALQITIAFVPIEGALSHALSQMSDLQTHAFAKKIVFATPNTLMTMLQVVDRLWVRDKQQRQVATIATEAERLLDALTAFFADFENIEKQLARTTTAVDAARKRLDTSPQSVAARAKRLVEAGARGKKALAKELVPDRQSDDVVPLQLEDGDDGEGIGIPTSP
jgi:DNA recombination protein RmuC